MTAEGDGAPNGNGGRPRRIPEATVARLPVYLRALLEVAEVKTVTISSERLAELAGVNAAKVRKDLSYFGSYGTRGVGYDVEFLLFHIRRELGLTHDWPCVIAGMGISLVVTNTAGTLENNSTGKRSARLKSRAMMISKRSGACPAYFAPR